MPERPKRRKNNKNKRKNNKPSNQIVDANKNNANQNENSAIESCSNLSICSISNDTSDVSPLEQSNVSNVIESHSNASEAVEEQCNNETTISNTNILPLSICPISNDTSDVSPLELTDSSNAIESSSNASEAVKDQSINETTKSNTNILSLSKSSISNDTTDASPINSSNVNKETEIKEKNEFDTHTYIVETPEQATKVKPKLDSSMKSKSCDNDDSPTIVEITDEINVPSDENLSSVNNNFIISNEESNVEWEEVNNLCLPMTELIKGVLSSDTIPLNVVRCDQVISLSPEEESSLRSYLKTLKLSTNPSYFDSGDIKTEIEQIINREVTYRLRKKGFTDDNLYVRAGPSRSLAVIDEEGSGDSSKTSRRQSYLSDKKSDNEELEDDVFESKPIQANVNNSTDFQTNSKHLIPQKCIRVDAKLKEPEISEARGDWIVETIEKMTGAELVYLTDSSSSTSSIYDANEDTSKGEETDVSIRMITPTIEVTDTETLLSNVFIAENSDANMLEKDNVLKFKSTQESNSDSGELNTRAEKDNLIETKNFTPSLDDTHEIVVLSTDNLKTNLFVKDLDEVEGSVTLRNCPSSQNNNSEDFKISKSIPKSPEDIDEYDLEIKVLKCELNDAINNLIKEVTSDSENNGCSKENSFSRQDSSSSLDSSQCTAKYNPNYSSLNDVSNILQDEHIYTAGTKHTAENSSGHVKDVLRSISLKTTSIKQNPLLQPLSLRDICLSKISSFPFGHKILEELANVSERLQNSVLATQALEFSKNDKRDRKVAYSNSVSNNKENNHIPPPVKPRRSSLRKKSDEQIKTQAVSPKTEVRGCLSPSQKMLMEKTNTVIRSDDIVQKEKRSESSPVIHNEEKKLNNNLSLNQIPMKSQTGSRLLALLLDSGPQNRINATPLNDNNFRGASRMKSNSETFSKRAMEEIESANFSDASTDSRKVSSFSSNSFKPIPPPKPKKLGSYFYESDESSDFRETSFRSMQNNRRYFHYSTGNLNKEIESDVSSIQNMHRYCTDLRDNYDVETTPRRPSLPKDLCDRQMEYIRQKEKEVDAEIRRLEQERNKITRSRGPRAPMISEKETSYVKTYDSKINNFSTPQSLTNLGRKTFSSSQEELLREKMYSEYVSEMAEREHRKQHRVIKVTRMPSDSCKIISKSMPVLENVDSKVNNRIEQEFISKARERWHKLGINDPETEDEKESENVYSEPKVIEHKIKVIDAGQEKDVQKLPTHMQDFVKFTVHDKDSGGASSGESDPERTSGHVVFCAVFILVLTVGKFLLRLFRHK